MDKIYLLVDAITLLFMGYIFIVYLRRAFKGDPVAKKDNGKVEFTLDLAVLTLVFVTFFLDMLVDVLNSLVNFLGV